LVPKKDEGFPTHSVGDPLDSVGWNIAFAPLDARKIGSVHIDPECKILPAQPRLFPGPSDVRANDRAQLARVIFLHAARTDQGWF